MTLEDQVGYSLPGLLLCPNVLFINLVDDSSYTGEEMNERQFIITLAVTAFNQQYNRSIAINECDVKSILPNQSSTIAYEIFTVRLDDYVRMRLYLNYGQYDNIGQYRLEVDGTEGVGILGDEVYVASGFVDSYYRESGLYKFNWLDLDITSWNILLLENNEALITESGEYFIEEAGA